MQKARKPRESSPPPAIKPCRGERRSFDSPVCAPPIPVAPLGLWGNAGYVPGARAPGYTLSPLRGCLDGNAYGAGYRGGWPASTAATSSTTAFIPAWPAAVRAPTCGVNTVPGAASSGWPAGNGSGSVTSSPAPAS